jgi:signal transduction histidine kinase
MGKRAAAKQEAHGREPASHRLRLQIPAILADWSERVRASLPAAREYRQPALYDHLPEYLERLADALEPGSGAEDAYAASQVGVLHGEQRALYTDYTLEDVLREYHFLHVTLLDRLQMEGGLLDERERRVLVDSIHHAVQEAATRFAELQELRRQEVDHRKDEFLAMLGHELRNPLGAITNALHLLDRSGVPDTRKAHLRAMMGRQVAHLTRLVDDLLDVSRIARGKIHLRCERVDLGALARHAAQTVRPQLENRSHRLVLELEDQVWVRGDPVRLEQVIGNLLSNAARYTPHGGEVCLSVAIEPGGEGVAECGGVGVAELRSGEVGESGRAGVEECGSSGSEGGSSAGPTRAVIRVRDNGIGITPEMLTQVFELFTQAKPPPEGVHAGLGIGLHLVQQLVELHGGTIEARSEGPGHGSEFRVELPLAE